MQSSRYEELSDEELIRKYRAGETQVEDYLLEKYKRVVRGKARELYLAGGDREDLLQEGMLGLFKAIRDYDPDKGTSFETYANLLISRQMYSAVLSAQRQKHHPLNSFVSISEMEDSREDAGLGTADSAESIVLDEENARRLQKKIEDSLSPMEKKVLTLYLEGYDYVQIASRLGKTPKSIDNALQRIRRKASGVL